MALPAGRRAGGTQNRFKQLLRKDKEKATRLFEELSGSLHKSHEDLRRKAMDNFELLDRPPRRHATPSPWLSNWQRVGLITTLPQCLQTVTWYNYRLNVSA